MKRASISLALPLALSLAVLCSACRTAPEPAKAEDPDAMRARDCYPLAVGNKWTYEMRANGQLATRTVEVTKEDKGFFVDTGGGVLRHDSRGLRDENRYLLMEPLSAGAKWTAVISVQSTERYEVVSAGRPCATPAGTFGRCVTVRATNPMDRKRSMVMETTYAEGVGIVELRSLQQEDGGTPQLQMQAQLTSYTLAQGPAGTK